MLPLPSADIWLAPQLVLSSLMFHQVGCSVVPPSGWSYFCDGMPNEHFEPSQESLIKWLEGYRISRGEPVGNPSLDVHEYNQRKIRNASQPSAPTVAHSPNVSPTKNLRERITQWLNSVFQEASSLQYVQEDEAEKRASICLACPQNQNWKTGCPPCVENSERVILMLTQGKFAQSNLQACNLCGHSNKVAVMLDKQYMNAPQDQLPSFCWLKENAV